jgi:microcystin-dependent protein
MFAGNFAPVGWAFCDGSLLAISENETLFNLIGTTYGGDGQSTFGLPNLQSRVPIHVGTNPANGNSYTLAQTGGVESVTLTLAQIPQHSHTPLASSIGAISRDPAGNYWAAWNSNQFSDQVPDGPMAAAAITAANGGSQPHDTWSPS